LRSISQKIPSEEVDGANEAEITNCDAKSAYIAGSEEILIEMKFLRENYYQKEFYTGRDEDMIHQRLFGIRFQNMRHTKMPNLYRWLIDSGIYDRLEEEKLARKIKKRQLRRKIERKKRENVPHDGISSLSGGLVTLFILCGGVICFAMVSFVLECRRLIWDIAKECCLNVGLVFEIWRQLKETKRGQKNHLQPAEKETVIVNVISHVTA
jgi:hypothetical protein